MAGESEVTVEQLTEAVNVAMNPTVSKDDRDKAYRICESFKENSDRCIPVGIELSFIQNPSHIRHFGLQLLENTVKFGWNATKLEDKVLVKESVMNLLSCGTMNILHEELYIKDGLAKIVVEMVKREWPQQWPTLMKELHDLSSQGETQTELVMLIFLRIVEDVIGFQNVNQINRRRDILTAINAEMKHLLKFLRELLRLYSEKMKAKRAEGKLQEAEAARKVADKVLLTLSCFIEYTPSPHIFDDGNALPHMLYMLLAEPELKLKAAECLLAIVSWKGGLQNKLQLMNSFSGDAIARILQAANDVSNPNADEQCYIFLKTLCEIIVKLIDQLCLLWAKENTQFKVPEYFSITLQTLLAFTSHDSVHICHMTFVPWSSLLRHKSASKHHALVDVMPMLFKVFTKTLQKVGMPSRNDHPSCHFSKMDFDNDDEFLQFSAIHRSVQVDIVRTMATLHPSLAFEVAGKWLHQLLASPLQFEEGATAMTQHSPSWHQWDALTSFMDSVMQKVLVIEDSLNTPALELLCSTLDVDIQDPLILSCVLTCVSALFPSVKKDTRYVRKVLDRLFAAAVYSIPGQTKKTRTRPVQNVRRHAICGLIRMCLDHPDLMVPFFDEIHMKTNELMVDPEQLTRLEKVNLYETLILISNQFKDFSRQSNLIKEVMEPVSSIWIPEATKQMLFPAEAFLHHVGLDSFPTSPIQEEALGSNRAHITNSLTHILAVMKRCCVPKDVQEAKNGGFVHGEMANGKPIIMNPAGPHVIPMLEHVLLLSWTLNAIWTPEVQAKVCPEYKLVFEIPEMEKHAILGASPSVTDGLDLPANRPMAEKTQSFLHSIHDQLCHIYASTSQCLGYVFFAPDGVGSKMIETVFGNIEYLPNFKMRNLIRVSMKHLVKCCPPECYSSFLIPILRKLGSLMLERLSKDWSAAQESEAEPGSDQEAAEILQDHLMRLITRDYLELLRLVILRKDSIDTTDSEMDTGEEKKASSNNGDYEQVGPLGVCAMQDPELCQSLIFFVYSAMSWKDSLTAIRSSNLAGLILPQILSKPLLPDAAAQLFIAILKGLNVNGEFEQVKSPLVIRALQHYEALRPKFQSVEDVLRKLPDAEPKKIEQFYKHYIRAPQQQNCKPADRKKKEAFRKLINGIVGQPVNQMFKRNVYIKNLPRFYREKVKPQPLDATAASSEELALASLFAND